jgi:hypothetical protein
MTDDRIVWTASALMLVVGLWWGASALHIVG